MKARQLTMAERVAVQRDIEAGRMTSRQIADKHDIKICTVYHYTYGRTPAAVVAAMTVKPVPAPNAVPWATMAMLMGGRAPVARHRP